MHSPRGSLWLLHWLGRCAPWLVLIVAIGVSKPAWGCVCPIGTIPCSLYVCSCCGGGGGGGGGGHPPGPPLPPAVKRSRCIQKCRRAGTFAECVDNSAVPDPWEPGLSARQRVRLCKNNLKNKWCAKQGDFTCPKPGTPVAISVAERTEAVGSLQAPAGKHLLALVTSKPSYSFRLTVNDEIVEPLVARVLGEVSPIQQLLMFAIPAEVSGQARLHYRYDNGAPASPTSDGHADFELPAPTAASSLFFVNGHVGEVTRIRNDGSRTAGREFLRVHLDGQYASRYSSQDFISEGVRGTAYIEFSPLLVIGGQRRGSERDSSDRVDLNDVLPSGCDQQKGIGPTAGPLSCSALFEVPAGSSQGSIAVSAGDQWLFSEHPLNNAVVADAVVYPVDVPRSGLGGDWRFTFTNLPVGSTIAEGGCRTTLYDGYSDQGGAIYAAGDCTIFKKDSAELIASGKLIATGGIEPPGTLRFSSASSKLLGSGTTIEGAISADYSRIDGQYLREGMVGAESFTAVREE